MTPRSRGNTAADPTPVEETGPTSAPQPAPEPQPEPDEAPADPEQRVGDDWRPESPWELHPDTMDLIARQTKAIVGDALSDVRRGPFGFLTAQRDDCPLGVHEAIAEVTRQVNPIAKTGRASGSEGGYAFRGIDQVLEALHPILADVGLVIAPGRVVRETWDTRATAKGGTLNVARLLVRYTFIGPDGTRLRAEAWGEAGDSGDKATQKAHSQSYKTLCLQTFSIPTQQSAEDEPDAVNEGARPFTAGEQQRALAAYDAAVAADTVEKLAGVRRRALALLPVPVRMTDESLVPLSVLFDRRLAALDAATPGGEG